MDLFRAHVLVCGGTGCSSSGSAELIKRFEEQIAQNGLEKEVKVVRTGCFGLCEAGPVVIVYPEGTFYSRIKVDDVDEIVSEHLLKGRIVQHLIYKEKADEEQHSTLENIDFYRPQLRLALRNCGRIDPENIDEYIAFDGYRALGKALTEMTPQQVIDEVLKSGLRGRGGAGSPPLPRLTRSTWSATPTRATRVLSWIVPFWKATPTRCWKPWPSAATLSAPASVISMSAPSIPSL